jgi:hypothetical protein
MLLFWQICHGHDTFVVFVSWQEAGLFVGVPQVHVLDQAVLGDDATLKYVNKAGFEIQLGFVENRKLDFNVFIFS